MPLNPSNHGIGRRFKDASLDHVSLDYFEAVFLYLQDYRTYLRQGQGLLLSGNPGVGKTYATAALMMRLHSMMGSLFDFHMVTAPTLFDTAYPLKETDAVYDHFRNKSLQETYESVRALLINDLGKEDRISEWKRERSTYVIGRMLRARHERGLPIFITTNLPLVSDDPQVPTFEQTYGPSIWSLIQDMTAIRAEITGPDLRRDAAEAQRQHLCG